MLQQRSEVFGDAEDVTQTVLVKLAEKMRDFQYDPSGSFRGWLKTVAHNAWNKFVSSRHRGGRGSGDTEVNQMLDSVAARDDLVAKLEEEFRKLHEKVEKTVTLPTKKITKENAAKILKDNGLQSASRSFRFAPCALAF